MGRAGAATLAGHCRVMCSAAQVVCLMSGFARIARRPPPFIFPSTPQDNPMPVISVTLLSGYAADVQARVAGRLAHAVRSVVPASDAGTTVYIHEASTYQRRWPRSAGWRPCLARRHPEVVRDFLQAMGQRDLAAAAQCVAPGFEMVFPGHRRMRELAELGTWAATRYRDVQKDYERFDESWQGSHTVVFCSGTLFGHWPDGRAFAGVRFIDRFEVEGGKIRLQEVWNDLGEHR